MKARDTFAVRLGARLVIRKFGIGGCPGDFLAGLLAHLMGAGVDWGIYTIDISLTSIEAGTKLAEFRRDALVIYRQAKSKLHTDEEKRALRKQALDVLDRFTSVGVFKP